MFTKFQTQRYVYETNISTKALAYKITFPEKKFFILSCILSVPLLHLRVIYNHLKFIKETEDKRKYLDDMYGIFEDIIDEDDIKLDPMVRDYTGYSLGEIGLIAYVEGTCGIYYRLQDAKVFGISFHDDNLPALSDLQSESQLLRICNSLLRHKIFLPLDYKSLNNLLSDNISERVGKVY